MAKQLWKPGTMIYPIPAVMVSCGDETERNIITVAWTGILATNPPFCYVSIRPERHSYGIIKRTMNFVINLTNRRLVYATDWCGVKSGREYDKFEMMHLTAEAASAVSAPLIKESPVNLECQVREIKPLGSHDVFIAEIVAIHADENYIDSVTGALDLKQTDPVAYCHGKYYVLGEYLGKFGFSVEKKKKKPAKKQRD